MSFKTNKMYDLVYVLLSLALMVLVKSESPTIRQTANGPVEGIEETSSLGQKYYAFRGVPYAEPPISERRFKAPEPLKRKWTENLNVKSSANFCIPAYFMFDLEMKHSEDCLYVNIYVPADGAKVKTVLVWIHGGAFIGGDPTDFVYGPDFLLSSDSILVLVQYRLGIFGFMNLNLDGYSGNMGLKDQQMALKWVYENIENFSGNKSEILLFGLSAGASSVHFQMLNVESRKYFHRAFLSSGTVFNYFALSEANHLALLQKYTQISDTTELIEFLKTTDLKTLNEYNSYEGFDKLLSVTWIPTIETNATTDAFITMHPEEMYALGKVLPVDILFGFTKREFITFDTNPSSEPILKSQNDQDSKFPLPFNGFDAKSYPNEYKQAIKWLRDAYFPDVSSSEAIKNGNTDLLSELNFGYGFMKFILLQINNTSSDKNTFLYRNSIDAGLSVFKVKYNLKYDSCGHADDLCYIYHCHMLDEFNAYDNHLQSNDVTYNAIMRMVKMITNFAKTGNPSIEGDTPFKPCKSINEIFCHEISNNSTSTITSNILDQLHYNTWHEIDELYKRISKLN